MPVPAPILLAMDEFPASIPASPGDRKVDAAVERSDEGRVPDLVERARAGERDAFGDLYRLYHAPIFRLVRFSLGPDAADDAAAETFARAWSSLPRYRDTGAPFVAWLYGIARHVVSDARRAAKRSEPVADPPERGIDPTGGQDDRLAIAALLGRLSKEQRQVIELKFLIGLRNEEVAAVLGKSAGAVNAQQWRALRALRDLMEER